MGNIVVGCDGSPSSAEAVKWAAGEGEARGWSVSAVLAWDYLSQPGSESGRPFDPHFTASTATLMLERYLVEALGERAAQVRPVPVCDLPARALLEAAGAADLLVVGARGLGTVRGALLGSVSHQCVHHSPVPVVVVRSPVPPDANRIVVAIDGSDGAVRALEWALDEARAHECPIRVVHVWHPSSFAAWSMPAAWPDTVGMQADAEDVIARALSRADTRGVPAERIERRAVFGTVVDGVLDDARDARLLVVGKRGRGGFAGLLLGSVSQHLVHHASCPIAVVPPAQE